jgi:hypothetical protein
MLHALSADALNPIRAQFSVGFSLPGTSSTTAMRNQAAVEDCSYSPSLSLRGEICDVSYLTSWLLSHFISHFLFVCVLPSTTSEAHLRLHIAVNTLMKPMKH